MFDTIIHDNIEQPASCPTINEGFFQDHLSGVAFRRRRKACKKKPPRWSTGTSPVKCRDLQPAYG